jgi:predicted aspartyl protease
MTSRKKAPREALRARAAIRFRIASASKPLLTIPVLVNGRGPFRFVLDTGASMTIVSAALGASLGLVPGKPQKGHGAGGSFPVTLTNVDSLAVGGVTEDHLTVALSDLTGLSRLAGTEIQGIVGYNVLRKGRLVVDYTRRTVILTRPR